MQEVKQAETDYAAAMDSALKSFVETVQETVQQTVEEKLLGRDVVKNIPIVALVKIVGQLLLLAPELRYRVVEHHLVKEMSDF